MAEINSELSNEQSFTLVSNIFIDEYMVKANPVFVIIYLLILRKSLSKKDISTENIAKELNILESDVINAIKYWNKEKIINADINNETIKIVFGDIKSFKEEISENIKKVTLETKPHYSTKEISMYKEKFDEVSQLFSMAERILAKPLSVNDLSVLLSLYDWLRLPLEVIAVLLTYCVSNNHSSMRYIEKTAANWAENGIDTAEKAEDYLQLFNGSYREIMKVFGISSRNPSPKEQKYMNKWIKSIKMPLEIIKEACNKAIIQTGKVNFPYADGIIEKWHNNNITSLEDIKELENNFNLNKKDETIASSNKIEKPSSKLNKFVNYNQRDWNFDELKKLERQLLDKDLEG